MPPVVVAASPNNFNFGVCDFGPSPPTAVSVNPTFAGNCVVDCDGGTLAIAGDFSGNQIQLFDLTNPATPAPRGTATLTGFGGIGAVAIRGTLAAAGERNGFRVALIDVSNPNTPSVIATATTALGGFSSLAFIAARIVVAGGPNGPPNAVRVDFNPTPPTVASLSPGFVGGMAVDADAAAGRIVVGNMTGSQVVLMNATGTVLATVNTGVSGVGSVAISGTLVLAAGPNTFTFERINFATSPPARATINPNYGSGSVVALEATTGACGAIVGGATTPVKLLDLSVTPPVVGAGVNPTVASVASLAMGVLTAAPPNNPQINLSTTALAFGTVRVGQTSQLALTIANTGTAALNVTNIQSSSARFTFSPAAPFTVQPGQTRTVNVTFSPNAEQAFSGTLTVTSNDPMSGSVSVAMSGTGALPHIAISPAAVNFGSVPVCLQGTSQVTIQNSGGVALTVSSITTSAPFSASPASAVVPPGGSRVVTVTFTPSALGAASGSLTIASDDPATPTRTVTLTGNGAPTPPPAITVSPTTFAFGAVPRQYFAGMRVTVANAGPCQSLSVTLSTSGAPFFVTDVDPTTVPTSAQPVSASIGPGASKRFAVVFAPTVLGASSGTLTIASNDPANSSQTIPLSGNGVDPSPAALELVLDRSGSMSDPVAGGTKMDALKRAVGMFADLVIPSQGDEMGSVEFDDQFAVLTPRGAYDAAKQSSIKTDVATLTPRGFTSIGGGLQLGQSQLGGSGLGRKVILVMTDGIENTPPMIAAVKPAIIAAGIESYALGFGQPQTISVAALTDLAASSNGKFFLDDDPLILRKNFAQVLADAFRQNMAADPILTVPKGQTIEVPVWITDCDRRITFIANWDDPTTQIGLQVVAPDGTVFTPTSPGSNQLVRYGQHPGYRFFQIAFPRLDSGGYIGPKRDGRWIMRLSGAQLSKAQRCATSVLVESELVMSARARGADVRKPLALVVTLTEGRKRLSNADVRVTVTMPTKSLAQVLTPALLKKFVDVKALDDATGLTVVERAVRHLSRSRQKLIPTKTKKFRLKAERGVFRLELPAPLVEGVYQFEIEVTGKACGGTFQRYSALAFAVTRPMHGDSTTVDVTKLAPQVAVVSVTPRDVDGKPLGAGLGQTISGTVRGGEVTGVIDNLDGSYTVRAVWSPRVRRAILRLEIGEGRLAIPLVATRGKAKGASRRS